MKKSYQWIKNLLPYLVVVLAITLPWFFSSGYLFFTDFVLGPQMQIEWWSGWVIYALLIKILSFVLPLALVGKLAIGATLLAVLLGGEKIAENFLEDKYQIFTVSLFALFNPFIYDRLMYGQVGMVLAFGFFCLAIGYLLSYLKEERGGKLLIAGLFSGLAAHSATQFIFFIGLIYLLFIILFFTQKRSVSVWSLAKGVLCAAGIVIVLNFNWIVSFLLPNSTLNNFLYTGIQVQDLEVFRTGGGTPGEVFKNVIMMSGFWGNDQYRYADLTAINSNWGRSFYFLLPLMLWGLVAGLRDKNKRWLVAGSAFLFLLSVFLAAGIKAPVAKEVSLFLFNHFIFYRGFREPQKWVTFVVIFYTILLAIGAGAFFKKKIVEKNKAIFEIILIIIIITQAPLLLWGFAGQARPAQYPADWYEADKFITSNSQAIVSGGCDGKILFLPWHMYTSFGFTGKVIASPAKIFFTCPVISGTNMEAGSIYDNSGSVEGKMVEEWKNNHGQTNLLQNSEVNIHYIILTKDMDWESYSWLKNLTEVELVKDYPTLSVYQIKNYAKD